MEKNLKEQAKYILTEAEKVENRIWFYWNPVSYGIPAGPTTSLFYWSWKEIKGNFKDGLRMKIMKEGIIFTKEKRYE